MDQGTNLLSVYGEICKSYHELDNFRMKLLGLLPLTSLIGIFGLANNTLFAGSMHVSNHLVGFIGIFAMFFTLALFIYEIRGILRCHDLIEKGKAIESRLQVKGQFHTCVEAHESKRSTDWIVRTRSNLDAKFAACFIYSLVSAAWLFTTLRFGFDVEIQGCAFLAVATGIIICIGTLSLVKKMIAA